MTSSTLTRRKVLVPLATLLAAGAIAVGSGASFTSTSQNVGSSFTTGTLTQSNSRADEAIFTLSDLKPGDTVTGSVTIANTGSLASTFTLTETDADNGFVVDDNLWMTVTDVTEAQAPQQVWSGTFASMGTVDLGTWDAGDSHTFEFSTSLKLSADNAEQGRTAGASYTWNGVQANDGDVHASASTQP